MGLKDQPAFRKWLDERRRRDREAGIDARGETRCTACHSDLDGVTDEANTCLVCLAVEYGRQQAEAEIGVGLVMFHKLLTETEPAAIGAAIAEIAVYAAEVAVVPLMEEGIVGRRH